MIPIRSLLPEALEKIASDIRAAKEDPVLDAYARKLESLAAKIRQDNSERDQ